MEVSRGTAAHGRPAYNGFRSGRKRFGNSDRWSSYRLGRKLRHGTTASEMKGPTGDKVGATNESVVAGDDAAPMSSSLLDDSDRGYIPGPPRSRSLHRTKTGMK